MFRFLLASLGLFSAAAVQAAPYHFATREQGQAAATQPDGFFESMRPFELKLRAAELDKASLADVKAQHRDSVLAWDPAVQAKVQASLGRISARLAPYAGLLPAKIDLVYVSEKFEDALPHTRGDTIFLPTVVGGLDSNMLDFVMAHETFHTLSRASGPARDSIYGVIGFKPCRFVPPRMLLDRHITNPDAPKDTHYVTVEGTDYVPYVYGKDSDVTAPLQLNEQLTARLVTVDVKDGRCTPREGPDGQPILTKASELPKFFEVVGGDSTYAAHPEELLADDFALMITTPEKAKSPEVQERLRQALLAAESAR